MKFKKIFNKYKIKEFNNKFYLLINTGMFKWEYLSWIACSDHYQGEYYVFNTYESAEQFAEQWCKHKPLTRWFKEEK